MDLKEPTSVVHRPELFEIIAISIIFLGTVARTLTWPQVKHLLGWYLGFEFLFIFLFFIVLLLPQTHILIKHAYFSIQSVLILWTFSLWPDFNFVVILFVPLCYQAALQMIGASRIIWISIPSILILASMFIFQGLIGLAEGLLTMTGGVVLSLYVVYSRQMKADKHRSQELLEALQVTNQKLQFYTLQVEELTTLEERNRLSRVLHDSVSQNLFSITLNTRAAQILLDRDPSRVRGQLEQLQKQIQAVLDDMRQFIIGLRTKE